jgi:hypothetical protein
MYHEFEISHKGKAVEGGEGTKYKFKINILNYATLPSITFANFRLNFMKENLIPKIKGYVYNDIKNAFYGGFVDVYKP